jgi:membrane protein DedA with SNARE-associated domain
MLSDFAECCWLDYRGRTVFMSRAIMGFRNLLPIFDGIVG